MLDGAILLSLGTSAFFMGVAGLPHCAVMCAAPCAAATKAGLSWPAVVGRTIGYALLGAVAAHFTAWVAAWSIWAGKLQSIWLMALMATVLLGGWMLWAGGLPAWMAGHGASVQRKLQGQSGGATSVLLGMGWAALPCGLLYSAIVVATLAPGAWQGALVMVAFSLPGGLLLKFLPSWWHRWSGGTSGMLGRAWVVRMASPQWSIRMAGAMLAGAATWGLSHRLYVQWQVWCA